MFESGRNDEFEDVDSEEYEEKQESPKHPPEK